ncbi:MAG: hypothetical protein EXS38_06495 [Opitutus sp.]|nr:hypothetical protein [Opitutus sp.]
MIHFPVAFALLLHAWFWGAGLAMLAMPRPWRRFWPVLVLPAGFVLQSAVVWAGAYANLPGTNSYFLWVEAIPATLFALAVDRRGLRPVYADLSRFGLVWAAVGGCLLLLVLPLALASKGLTTISLGSNDAADYAAGARVLMEFAHSDRSGFLGLTEVVRVHSVDNFFDYWLRLNHFTPAALLALNGSVLRCPPHELVSLLTMVLLAASLPVVFWVARAVIGYSGVASVAIAAVYGVSPITWYAVAHVAPGQLLAAQAIALITWAGIALWRGRLTWRLGAHFAGVLAIAYGLLLGSYNFMLVLCLVPAVAYTGGLVLGSGEWKRLWLWTAILLAPLGACAVLFAGRVAGLLERFMLLREYDFGWRIPVLGPEGWLGMVRGPDLRAWEWGGLRWGLTLIVAGLLGWALVRAGRQGRRAAWTVTALAVPVLIGYAWLEGRGAWLGTNASYDAYKLFAGFFPVLLPALCWWVTLRRSHRLHEWLAVVAVAAVIVGFNLVACGMFIFSLSRPPFMVDGELRQLRRVDAMTDVKSVNLLIPDMWSRLWANAFLLHKGQYFLTHTYEGRLNTPLRGEWDLEGGRISLKLPGEARRQITPRFALVNTRAEHYVRVTPGEGWHVEEMLPKDTQRWQWTSGDAQLNIDNPHDQPVTLTCRLDGHSFGERDVVLELDGGPVAPPSVHLGAERRFSRFAPIVVPPGRSTLRLRSIQPGGQAGPGDPRLLAICVFGLEIETR